ncbi:hypothetical protein VTO73DRAFT_10013 [Trametes versicolor]
MMPDTRCGRQTSILSALNNDVVMEMLEELSIQSLSSLSQTSKCVRELCLPLLFRDCRISSWVPLEEVFLPKTLWRYVRTLHLNDECPDMPLGGDLYMDDSPDLSLLAYATDPVICCIYDGPTLRNALSNMPALRSITLGIEHRTVHGIPWPILQFILSLPQLREFSLRFHHLAPKTPLKHIRLPHPAPLTSFQFILHDHPPQSSFYDAGNGEESALYIILGGVHKTMERLALNTETAPLRAISTTFDWPNLRELRFRGERRTVGDPPMPFVAIFANMPRLRVLELKLAQPAGAPPQPIWPIGYRTTSHWPELQELTLSYPVEDDQIYVNLPASLRTLTLQCFPHRTTKYNYVRGEGGLLPPLLSSDVLRILRHCDLPLLHGLELEYREDNGDDELLRHLGVAFPTLRQLKVRRYRRAGADYADVPVEHIARTIGTRLVRLSELALCLDNVKPPGEAARQKLGLLYHTQVDLEKCQQALDEAADVVARGLGPAAIEAFELLHPPMFPEVEAHWITYRVERGQKPPRAVRMTMFWACG